MLLSVTIIFWSCNIPYSGLYFKSQSLRRRQIGSVWRFGYFMVCLYVQRPKMQYRGYMGPCRAFCGGWMCAACWCWCVCSSVLFCLSICGVFGWVRSCVGWLDVGRRGRGVSWSSVRPVAAVGLCTACDACGGFPGRVRCLWGLVQVPCSGRLLISSRLRARAGLLWLFSAAGVFLYGLPCFRPLWGLFGAFCVVLCGVLLSSCPACRSGGCSVPLVHPARLEDMRAAPVVMLNRVGAVFRLSMGFPCRGRVFYRLRLFWPFWWLPAAFLRVLHGFRFQGNKKERVFSRSGVKVCLCQCVVFAVPHHGSISSLCFCFLCSCWPGPWGLLRPLFNLCRLHLGRGKPVCPF